jgi:pimeloyl-ACP methyl ester carboxylesterase
MPRVLVRGVKLVHEVLGKSGPWVVISPGGRRGLASDRALGVLLAEAGFRVLVYDRRNTGASEIGFPGQSESPPPDGAAPAIATGAPPSSAKRLAFNYYEQFIAAAEQGGIEAVVKTEHFGAMVAANPANRKILEGMGAEQFLAAMRRWLAGFHQGSGHPVAGLSPDEMRRIALPTLIVPGNDRIHPLAPDQAAHRLMPNSEYREVMAEDVDVDVDFDAWARKNGTLAATFIDFLRRRERAA